MFSGFAIGFSSIMLESRPGAEVGPFPPYPLFHALAVFHLLPFRLPSPDKLRVDVARIGTAAIRRVTTYIDKYTLLFTRGAFLGRLVRFKNIVALIAFPLHHRLVLLV
jgi:hypothetical protein